MPASSLSNISNVFNLIAQFDTRILNYHFGWQSDINREIDNNFDEGNATGRMFPAVQMDIPDWAQYKEQPSYLGTLEDLKVILYFYDLEDYNNDSSEKTSNLVEQMTNLKTIADDFLANILEVIGPKKYNIGYISNPRIVPRAMLHNDRLIVWEAEFVFSHTTICTDSAFKVDLTDLAAFPEILPDSDIENYA